MVSDVEPDSDILMFGHIGGPGKQEGARGWDETFMGCPRNLYTLLYFVALNHLRLVRLVDQRLLTAGEFACCITLPNIL